VIGILEGRRRPRESRPRDLVERALTEAARRRVPEAVRERWRAALPPDLVAAAEAGRLNASVLTNPLTRPRYFHETLDLDTEDARAVATGSTPMRFLGGLMFRADLEPPPGVLMNGAIVDFTLSAIDRRGNRASVPAHQNSGSAPWQECGARKGDRGAHRQQDPATRRPDAQSVHTGHRQPGFESRVPHEAGTLQSSSRAGHRRSQPHVQA
jgi:hypothetical protein